MNYKYNNKNTIIIAGITIVVSIVSFNLFIKNKSKEMSTYNRNNLVWNMMKSKTLTEIIKDDINKPQKGPIPKSDKIAYITIDDGPSKYTDAILDILSENNVRATFFMLNGNMKKHPEQVKRIESKGHGVGFHSVTHDVKQLYETPQATIDEFETCQETYYELTNEKSELIRIPYGSKPYMPQESYEALVEEGYKIWDWNLDTQDWRASTDNIVSNVLYYGRNKSNLIILMHEKEQTVNALESMIKVLKERGYDILPITEELQEQNYWKENL